MQSAILDVTLTPNNAPDTIESLFEEICDPNRPLPFPRLISGVLEWKKFATFLGNRIKAALFAIQTHPTDAKMTTLHVGGDLGIFAVLRMLEFLRRCTKTVTLRNTLTKRMDVDKLVEHAEVVLSREMWRRWAGASMVRVRHRKGGKLCGLWHIFVEACLQQNDEWRVHVLNSEPSSPDLMFSGLVASGLDPMTVTLSNRYTVKLVSETACMI